MMKSVRFCLFLIFFAFMFNYQAADAASAAGSIASVVTLPISLPIKIATLPIKLVSIPLKLITKLPTFVVKEVILLLTKIFQLIGTLSANGITDISQLIQALITLIQEIVTAIVNGLVSIGVFQGKSAEEIINFVMTLVKTLLAFLSSTEMKISSQGVNTILGILKTLKIPDILNLPVISLVKKEVINIFKTLKGLLSNKAGMIMQLAASQIDKHRDFFQPIFNAISSRVLIVTNSMQAFIGGDLNSCPGSTLPSKSPAYSLMWQLNVWIDKYTVTLFKIMGLTDWADKAQIKLDEELAKMNPE